MKGLTAFLLALLPVAANASPLCPEVSGRNVQQTLTAIERSANRDLILQEAGITLSELRQANAEGRITIERCGERCVKNDIFTARLKAGALDYWRKVGTEEPILVLRTGSTGRFVVLPHCCNTAKVRQAEQEMTDGGFEFGRWSRSYTDCSMWIDGNKVPCRASHHVGKPIEFTATE